MRANIAICDLCHHYGVVSAYWYSYNLISAQGSVFQQVYTSTGQLDMSQTELLLRQNHSQTIDSNEQWPVATPRVSL